MPRGDRTGPMGFGPMSGRGMGYCAGSTGPGFMSPGPGFGFGRVFGFGRGRGRGMGFGRGRGWRQAGFGRLCGYPYPPGMPYGYPYGMSYGYPFPHSYGYPYGMGYEPEYPAPRAATGSRQKK
jgi:hypothetical protein